MLKYLLIAVMALMASNAYAETSWQDANKKAVEYYQQENFSEAAKMGERALALYKKQDKMAVKNYAHLVLNLVDIYSSDKKFSKVEGVLRRAIVKGKEIALDNEKPYLFSIYRRKVDMHDALGEYREGERLFQKMMALAKDIYGDTSDEVAALYVELGNRYKKTRGVFWARAQLNYARKLQLQSHGENSLGVLRVDYALASLNLQADNFSNAQQQLNSLMEKLQNKKDKNILFLKIAVSGSLLKLYKDTGKDQSYSTLWEELMALQRPDGDAIPVLREEIKYEGLRLTTQHAGDATVQYSVQKDGTPKNVKLLSNTAIAAYGTSAVRAVKEWRFLPKLVNGVAVEQQGVNDVFHLDVEKRVPTGSRIGR